MSDAVVQSAAVSTAGSAAPGLWGYLVEFKTPDALVEAANLVREEGYTRWDAHSPYPVHGLDSAMGVRPTILPLLVFCGGVAGFSAALLMQWWMNAVDYKFLVSGKPFFSLPANIPIIFELTVLLSALTAFMAALGLNQLPQLYHALFHSERFRRVTRDRFFISIEAADPLFSEEKTRKFLESLGGAAVEKIEE